MDLFLKLSKQTLWQIFGKVVTSISTFLILGIIARNYGESGTGVFTLALTYLAIFYLLADFGFNAHLLNEFQNQDSSKQTDNFRKLLGTRIVWGIFLCLVAVITLPFWPFGNTLFNSSVILGSLAIVCSAIFITSNLVFQSKLRYDFSVAASSMGTLIGLGMVILFSVNNLSLPYAVLAHFVGWLGLAVVALVLVRKYITNLSPCFDVKFAQNLFKDSWPIAATLALNVVYFRVDSFLLAIFKTSADVGVYNLAFQVFQSALVLPTFIMNSYYPLMLKSLKTDIPLFKYEFKMASIGLFSVSLIGAVFTFVFAPIIIETLSGGGFIGSVTSLQILSLGFPAYFVSSILMWLLVAKKQYKTMLAIYALGLVFNFVANYIYIPQYSFIAASTITVVSEYLILLLLVLVIILPTRKHNS